MGDSIPQATSIYSSSSFLPTNQPTETMAGNFFQTAQNIRLEDRHILRASLQRVDGEWQDAEIDLNQFIGNEDGHFQWDSAGFSDSAEDIWFSVEGDGPVGILRAKLRTVDGELVDRDLNLSERLGNNDGNFNWC